MFIPPFQINLKFSNKILTPNKKSLQDKNIFIENNKLLYPFSKYIFLANRQNNWKHKIFNYLNRRLREQFHCFRCSLKLHATHRRSTGDKQPKKRLKDDLTLTSEASGTRVVESWVFFIPACKKFDGTGATGTGATGARGAVVEAVEIA